MTPDCRNLTTRSATSTSLSPDCSASHAEDTPASSARRCRSCQSCGSSSTGAPRPDGSDVDNLKASSLSYLRPQLRSAGGGSRDEEVLARRAPTSHRPGDS